MTTLGSRKSGYKRALTGEGALQYCWNENWEFQNRYECKLIEASFYLKVGQNWLGRLLSWLVVSSSNIGISEDMNDHRRTLKGCKRVTERKLVFHASVGFQSTTFAIPVERSTTDLTRQLGAGPFRLLSQLVEHCTGFAEIPYKPLFATGYSLL